jgi:hypothetical protein
VPLIPRLRLHQARFHATVKQLDAWPVIQRPDPIGISFQQSFGDRMYNPINSLLYQTHAMKSPKEKKIANEAGKQLNVRFMMVVTTPIGDSVLPALSYKPQLNQPWIYSMDKKPAHAILGDLLRGSRQDI